MYLRRGNRTLDALVPHVAHRWSTARESILNGRRAMVTAPGAGGEPLEPEAAEELLPDKRHAIDPTRVDTHPPHLSVKIHVIGGPGSGKTTVGRQIASRCAVPFFELDEIAGAGPAPEFRMQHPLAERLADADRIAALPGWVTEGSFLGWTDTLLRAADLIVWLDVPTHVALRRVLMRHFREYLKGAADQAGLVAKLRSLRYPHARHLLSFVPYTWNYYHALGATTPRDWMSLDSGWSLSQADTARELDPYQSKVIRCVHTADAATLLHRLEHSSATGMLAMPTAKEASPMMHAGSDQMNTVAGQHVSAYAEMHKADWIPGNYDENIYNPSGYDSFVWTLYKPVLVHFAQSLAADHARVKYLDFACGTGRIFAELAPFATEAVGVDISPQMIEFARSKVSGAELRCGDILSEPEIVGSDFDLITAFRFFLNTELEMRQLVMHSLANRLAGPKGRLIFNVHANGWSVDALQSLYQRLRGWGRANTMTLPEVRRLVEDAGLEIEAWYGFALWPHRLYRGRLSHIVRWCDQQALHMPALRWISHDMVFVCRRRSSASEA